MLFNETAIDYNIDGKEVTFGNKEQLGDLKEIKVGYGYTIPADSVFSKMTAEMGNTGESIYDNLKRLTWEKLIELGYVSGTIV